MEYKVFVPAPGGYQSYGSHSFHSMLIGNNGNNWDNIDFGFGGAFYSNASNLVILLCRCIGNFAPPRVNFS